MPVNSQQAIVATIQAAAARAGVPSAPSTAQATPGAAPAVQRLAEVTGSSSATSQTADTGPSPVTSNVSAPTAPAEHSEADIEDLARQLYPRFRTRLKSDLLADRERSGRLFDR